MSQSDGWSALHLEMPKRVPRTEYSATGHYALMKAVTGIDVRADSPPETKHLAVKAFVKAWHYDFQWSTLIVGDDMGEKRTSMGHAVYAAGGVDYDNKVHCPFPEPEDVLRFDPMVEYGPRDRKTLIRRFEEHYRRQCEDWSDGVSMTGIYITLVSGLIEIFGWEMLLAAAGQDPKGFGEVTNRYARWIGQFFDALGEADVPVVMIHDDMVWTAGAIFHPDWYRTYVFPNYRRLFAPILDSGKRLLFTSDGGYTEFIDDIAACGVHGFVMEPMTDMNYIAERYGKTRVFIGNADTRILLSGTKPQIRAEVERCMAIGKKCPGFFLAVGNHIPPNTPVESALYYNEVYEELGRR